MRHTDHLDHLGHLPTHTRGDMRWGKPQIHQHDGWMGHGRGGGRWGEHTKKAHSPNETLSVICVRYDGIDHQQRLYDARLALESLDYKGEG